MKLSEFKDEKAIEVVAKLLVPICEIASNAKNAQTRVEGGNVLSFVSAMLTNTPSAVKDMLAILNDEDPATYHCNAATVLRDAFVMISDEELLKLFGLQSQKKGVTSSGSASENIDGKA